VREILELRPKGKYTFYRRKLSFLCGFSISLILQVLPIVLEVTQGDVAEREIDELDELSNVSGVLILCAGAFFSKPATDEDLVGIDGATFVLGGIVWKLIGISASNRIFGAGFRRKLASGAEIRARCRML
jgi:hypothetical protein